MPHTSFLSALTDELSRADCPIPARVKEAVEDVIIDVQCDGRGVSLEELEDWSSAPTPFADDFTSSDQHQEHTQAALGVMMFMEMPLSARNYGSDFTGGLWDDPANKDVVDAFMNNRLIRDCTRGDPAALKAFETYAIQDYFYLIDYVKFRALRLSTVVQDDLPNLKREAESVSRSYSYIEDWYKACITTLGIDPDRFKTYRSVPQMAYANYLQNNCRMDSWFNLHVIMIACVYGWSKLALELYPTADKNTGFYKVWLLGNLRFDDQGNAQLSRSAVALAAFLEKNANRWTSAVNRNRYTELFRTTLRLETAFFDAAYV